MDYFSLKQRQVEKSISYLKDGGDRSRDYDIGNKFVTK